MLVVLIVLGQCALRVRVQSESGVINIYRARPRPSVTHAWRFDLVWLRWRWLLMRSAMYSDAAKVARYRCALIRVASWIEHAYKNVFLIVQLQ